RDFYKGESAQSALEQALEVARRAVVLDGNDATCHRALAMVHLNRRSFELAKRHFDMAMTLNPNDTLLAQSRALFEIFAGRPQAALAILDQAERLDPRLSNFHWDTRGRALYQLGQYAEAVAALERMTGAPLYVYRFRAACYAQLGRSDEARALATEALRR